MKIASYESETGLGCGEVVGNVIHPFMPAPGSAADIRSVLSMSGLERRRARSDEALPLSAVRLLPPVPHAGKILCVAVNFHEPARDGKPMLEYPLLFTRFADTLVGHDDPLRKPEVSECFDFEGEVAVVIGRSGHRIAREDALGHVGGYACFNDGSVRDWQKHSTQFTPGKNFHRSGAFGPWLVTADEMPDPAAMSIETRVNGVVKQAIGLDRFIFDIPWLIAYVTSFTPLGVGDVIVTGTPSGFGSSRTPPEFLRPGDVVEVEVAGIGTLRNRVTGLDS